MRSAKPSTISVVLASSLQAELVAHADFSPVSPEEVSMAAVSIRPAGSRDVRACGRIFYEAFRTIAEKHNFPPEVPSEEVGIGIIGQLFGNPDFYCVVAEDRDRVVGSNCLDERNEISGIGPISVDPGVQDSGIGRNLMRAVIDRSDERGFRGVRLVQDAYHCRSLSLYAKLDFACREQLVVMNGVPGGDDPSYTVRPATDADAASCNRLCAATHGFTRDGELRQAIAQGHAFVAERDGAVRAYTSALGYFGHTVGESAAAIGALLARAPHQPSPGVLVPTRDTSLFRWCLDHGMRTVQPMTLMTRGLYEEPRGPYLPSILF
jgi:predicted N-acetyltransferase YhbS